MIDIRFSLSKCILKELLKDNIINKDQYKLAIQELEKTFPLPINSINILKKTT